MSPEELYNPGTFLNYRKCFDEKYCGFLWCNIDKLAVFNDFTLKNAVETRAKDLLIRNSEEISELVKVCKVLLSETFARKLLTDASVKAFYDNEMYGDTFFNVRLGSRGINKTTGILRLKAEYTHRRYPREGEVREHVFKARFRFGYGFGKDGSKKGLREVCLKFLQVNNLRFRLNRFGEGIIGTCCKKRKQRHRSYRSFGDRRRDSRRKRQVVFCEKFCKRNGKEYRFGAQNHEEKYQPEAPEMPDSEDEAFGGSQDGYKRKKGRIKNLFMFRDRFFQIMREIRLISRLRTEV